MLFDSSYLVLRDRLLIALLQGSTVPFKVSLLIVVEANNVSLAPLH